MKKKDGEGGSDSARVSLIAPWKSANARINIAVTPQRRSRIATYPPDIPAYGTQQVYEFIVGFVAFLAGNLTDRYPRYLPFIGPFVIIQFVEGGGVKDVRTFSIYYMEVVVTVATTKNLVNGGRTQSPFSS
ncbi:hypothetical protein M0802_008104 [Mischocyttarus mexicanus]|nr:hypothetical protein M0802_008104 [Mischocyttarus mexicanus]